MSGERAWTGATPVAWLDASSGLSGDKLLAALLELGARLAEHRRAPAAFDLDGLRAAIERLGAGEARIEAERVTRCGIAGTHVSVTASHEPGHRTWGDIRTMIEHAGLPVRATEIAIDAFERIARAEATVHGVADPDDVHFHEVGATDSIVDIVGVALGIDALGLGRWTVSPIAVGSGLTQRTAHGTLPVPAPATLEILAGAHAETVGVGIDPGTARGELTTPTGAALALANAAGFGPAPAMTPVAVGYGAGTREFGGLANVLRIVVGEPLDCRREDVTLLETNVDHVSGEELAHAAEQLRAETGALDVWLTPITMKKGRAAVLLSVLADPPYADALVERIVALTGTLGVRRRALTRTVAERDVRTVETPWGPARVKIGAGRIRPEHDDVARIASEHALPYGFVRDEIARLADG